MSDFYDISAKMKQLFPSNAEADRAALTAMANAPVKEDVKVDQINEILRSSSNSKNSFIFIGDSHEDYDASLKNNIKFIGVKSRFTKFRVYKG